MASPKCCIPDCDGDAALGPNGTTNRRGRCRMCAIAGKSPPMSDSDSGTGGSGETAQPKPPPPNIPLVYDATDEQMDAVLAGIALSDDVNPSVRVQAAQARKGGKVSAVLSDEIAPRRLLTFPEEEVDNERRRAV